MTVCMHIYFKIKHKPNKKKYKKRNMKNENSGNNMIKNIIVDLRVYQIFDAYDSGLPPGGKYSPSRSLHSVSKLCVGKISSYNLYISSNVQL